MMIKSYRYQISEFWKWFKHSWHNVTFIGFRSLIYCNINNELLSLNIRFWSWYKFSWSQTCLTVFLALCDQHNNNLVPRRVIGLLNMKHLHVGIETLGNHLKSLRPNFQFFGFFFVFCFFFNYIAFMSFQNY